jgi:murein DD-endopeptidase MepM/ murein hydrolase activator NlpD
MRKVKYFYNTNTLRYEKLETPLHVKLLRVLSFIASSLVTALIIVAVAFRFLDSPKEKRLREQYNNAVQDYAQLNDEVRKLQDKVGELEDRDNNVYRAIFEANPLPDSARVKQIEKQKAVALLKGLSNSDLSTAVASNLNHLIARVAYQEKSYVEIASLMKNKEERLQCIPAIQPVRLTDLKRVASGYGMRIHPVLGIARMHNGLDFAAPQGTPIYSTGNGLIKIAGNTGNGFGNHVVINHGYGYETVYGHMVKVKVNSGQRVRRGELIGWVGSTGLSSGPHLHYEVHINGHPLNPGYFFLKDLNAIQQDELLKIADVNAKSLD